MERDFGLEIDELKKDIAEIKNLLKETSNQESTQEKKRTKIERDLAALNVHENGMCCLGNFQKDTTGSRWDLHFNITSILGMENNTVAKVLSVFSNPYRFSILKALLSKPMSVNELVTELNLNTTGQVYHHLNALIAANIVINTDNGYSIAGWRISGIMMILGGVDSLIDTREGKGDIDALTATE